jgi:hypothetical protein
MFIAEDYWPVPAVSAYNIVDIIEAQKHVGKEQTKKKNDHSTSSPDPESNGDLLQSNGYYPF